MKPLLRSLLSPWTAVILAGLAFILALDVLRMERVRHVSTIGDEPVALTTGAIGPTGTWSARLIVPEHDSVSLSWLSLTREMLLSGESRVRRIAYENAPYGRDVYETSPYRWWLGGLTWSRHTFAGSPWGASLEWAALWANPLLHCLLLLMTAALVAWRFGGPAAAAAAAALIAGVFPFGTEFLPGMPRDGALSHLVGIVTALLLILGYQSATQPAAKRPWLWFVASGIWGGLALWVSVFRAVPVLGGLTLGAVLAAWLSKRTAAAIVPPRLWRIWSLSGAMTTLAAYLIEFSPDYLGYWQTRAIHPLYALAWLGVGEALVLTTGLIAGDKSLGRLRIAGTTGFAIAAVAALPVTMRLTKSWGFWATEIDQLRLAHVPGGPSAPHTLAWVLHDGLTGFVAATLLPLVVLIAAGWWSLRRTTDAGQRPAVVIALSLAVVQFGYACRWLESWNSFGGAVVVLGAIWAGSVWSARVKLWWGLGGAALLAAFTPGAILLTPSHDAQGANSLEPREVFGLIERDLGRWLALRSGEPAAALIAPHNLTATLHYYGGLRGLSSLAWENTDGLGVAIRIASASTPEEARKLMMQRNVRYMVIPTWDAYLDVYAGIGMGELDGTFLKTLHEWKLPTWLRPLAYPLPQIPGFEGESVTILELVDDQEDAAALSRLAEYFVEMQQLDRAGTIAVALRRFPADFGALVARATVELARDDSASFARTIALIKPRLATRSAKTLPWDRRVSLAVVLTQAKLTDEAKDQLQQCLSQMDEAKLRSLSTGAIYRLLILSRSFQSAFPSQDLRSIALDLLPREMRQRVE